MGERLPACKDISAIFPPPSLTLESTGARFLRAPVTSARRYSERIMPRGNRCQKALLPVVPASKPVPTPALLLAMLGVSDKVSDLILSPGSFPMVELSGKLTQVKISGMGPLTPEDTRRIALELMGDSKQATDSLRDRATSRIVYQDTAGFA